MNRRDVFEVPCTVAGIRAFLLYVREIDWEGDAAVDVALASPVLMESAHV
jgi:hypothetical protein